MGRKKFEGEFAVDIDALAAAAAGVLISVWWFPRVALAVLVIVALAYLVGRLFGWRLTIDVNLDG